MPEFAPGSLVRARAREWVVLPSDSPDLLRLRPLGGSESETTGIYLPLHRALGSEPIEPATFPLPDPEQVGDAVAGRLLRDAARLAFRSGAGPFRSLGRLNVRPRPFQIVPLLMALRLEPVRLLIADDVGVGKTVEAALIARELLDRGEARRLTVLCPPHLCEQWQRELAEKFALESVIVRSSTLAGLERTLVGDQNLYERHLVTIVSIDFAKSPARRATFLQGAGDLVIVDEAHTASQSSQGGQQRHELLRALAANPQRHLLLLTATPHSGVSDAFRSLLTLLDPGFEQLDLEALGDRQRRHMARHFVQRRRADVVDWLGDATPFPDRVPGEATYSLAASPAYHTLFEDVRAFARELVTRATRTGSRRERRVGTWTALALLRCVMSSPAAAERTLRTRASRLDEAAGEMDEQAMVESVLELDEAEVRPDWEPTALVEEGEARLLGESERARLRGFARRAHALQGDGDPKVAAVAHEVATLLRDGFHPILFCRYIATADYLAAELQRRLGSSFRGLQVTSVTGALSDDERELRVAALAAEPVRVLVATDCLSEGVNLQEEFDAVLHYDLPWNPNRLEQREGRVDRYGQRRPEVRTILFYGSDNPVDGKVLDVLLRKAVRIHRSLGVMIPVPMNSEAVAESVLHAVLDDQATVQLSLFGGESAGEGEGSSERLQELWDQAEQRERRSRSRFAQHAMKPEEVAKELYASDAVLGDPRTVATFLARACERLGASWRPVRAGGEAQSPHRLEWAALPRAVRERSRSALAGRDGRVPDELLVAFEPPLPEGAHLVGRLHPLVEALAEHLLDAAMGAEEGVPPAARSGVMRTQAVGRRTTLLLLRVRMLIRGQGETPLLAEELAVAGFRGRPGTAEWLGEEEALRLLEEAQPAGNLAPAERVGQLEEALGWLAEMEGAVARLADERAAALLESHRRVRQATRTGRVTVESQQPPDVLGLYVLLPVPKGMA